MASKLIAHLAAWYIPTGRTDLDGMEGLTVDCGYLLEAQRMHTELEARARGKPLMVEIEIKPVRDKRTLDQNRLMWALLNKLALAMNGGTPGGVTAEQCYLDLLAEFGVEREIFEMPLRALPQFKRAYRVTHIIEHLPGGRCRVAAAPGTSCYTTQQMHDFIERIYDVVVPKMDPYCIAGIKGRGPHSAAKQVARWMKTDRAGMKYGAELDIHHCFPESDHDFIEYGY